MRIFSSLTGQHKLNHALPYFGVSLQPFHALFMVELLGTSAFYTKVGRLQLDLGQLEIMRNREVQQHVHEPVRAAIQQEYPVC